MGLTAKATGNSIEPMPEGVVIAACFAIYDLGTHFDETWGKRKHEVMFMWEVPEHRYQAEKDGAKVDLPRTISNTYTLSLHAKAGLRKMLENWRGKAFTDEEIKGFDVSKVLGASCQLQIVHKKSADGTKTYGNIGAIMALPKGVAKLKLENPLKFFSFEDASELDDSIPEWVQAKIVESDEWKAQEAAKRGESRADETRAATATNDDGLPF